CPLRVFTFYAQPAARRRALFPWCNVRLATPSCVYAQHGSRPDEETPFMRSLFIAVAAMAVVVAAGSPPIRAASPEWKPDRNVEFNVQSGAGSGSDVLARTLQSIWQARGLVRPSVTVVNKSAPIAMAFINQQSGNGHYLLMASTTFLTN